MRLGRVEAGLRSEQRVTVVLSPHHGLRRDRISSTAPVFHDDALLPKLREALGDGAGEHVGQGAGCRGHHDGHVAVRVGLSQRGGAREEAGEQKQAGEQDSHRSLRFPTLRPEMTRGETRVRYFACRASIRTLAAEPDEAGFWPVIRRPSLTVWTPQFLTLE